MAEIRFERRASSLSLLASKLFVQLLDIAGADVTEDRTFTGRRWPASTGSKQCSFAEIEDAIYELHATTVTLFTKGER